MASTFSSDTPSKYVSNHGERLRMLAGRGSLPNGGDQPMAPTLGQGPVPQGPAPAAALDAAPAPVAPAAAVDEQPAGKSFWDVTRDLNDDEKKNIAKQFEDQGVNIEAEYGKLESEGQVDPGMIKKGKDGKIDKQDMGMFLLEYGLRMMEKSSKPGASALGASGGAALETIDARRGRASAQQAALDAKAEKAKDRAERRQENIARATDSAADRKARGADSEADRRQRAEDAKADRTSRERMNRDDNLSATQRTKMAAGLDKRTFVDETDGSVYWVDTQEQVMVSDGNGGKKALKGKTQQVRGEVTAEQEQKAKAAIAKAKSEDLIGRYGPQKKQWKDLSAEERNQVVEEEYALTVPAADTPAWAR